MTPAEARGALDSLEGLLLLACHQGQGGISWDELCTLCEDAIVAAGLGGWDTNPLDAPAVVADLGQCLATHVVEWHAQRTRTEGRGGDHGDLRVHLLAVSDLLRTLAAMRTHPTDMWTTMAVA